MFSDEDNEPGDITTVDDKASKAMPCTIKEGNHIRPNTEHIIRDTQNVSESVVKLSFNSLRSSDAIYHR